MLKRICVKDVRLGMHIHELCGSWTTHPFWLKSFKLRDVDTLNKLISSEVKEVVIDICKGTGIAVVEVSSPPPVALAIKPSAVSAPQTHKPVSIEIERERAKKILAETKQAVESMFNEARMGKLLDTEHAMPLVDEITASIYRNSSALISLARLKDKDDYTYMHSVAVCALMIALARELNLTAEEISHAGLAGLLHDIGKLAIPLDILNKPGKLTDEEFEEVKLHTLKGYSMLQQVDGMSDITKDVCLHHHEKLDGSGYPDQLKDEEISLFAKMGAVCDVYDAVTSHRSYKPSWEPGLALQRMAQWTTHFDQVVFKAFVKSIGVYPAGSIVMLKSGRLAAVIDQTEKSLLKPIVKVFFSTKSNLRIPIEILNLSHPQCRDEIQGHEDPAKWGIEKLHDVLG